MAEPFTTDLERWLLDLTGSTSVAVARRVVQSAVTIVNGIESTTPLVSEVVEVLGEEGAREFLVAQVVRLTQVAGASTGVARGLAGLARERHPDDETLMMATTLFDDLLEVYPEMRHDEGEDGP